MKPVRINNAVYRQHKRYQSCIAHWFAYESGGLTLYDISGHGLHGTLQGSAIYTPNGISYNGTNAYVDCGNSTYLDMGSGAFSFVFWIDAGTQLGTVANPPTVFEKGAGDWTAGAVYTGLWCGYLKDSSNVFAFKLGDGSALIDTITFTELSNLGRTHVGIVVSGTTLTAYVNGIIVNSIARTRVGANTTAVNLNIARWREFNVFNYVGVIDDLRMYNRELTHGEVMSLYIQPYLEFYTLKRTG